MDGGGMQQGKGVGGAAGGGGLCFNTLHPMCSIVSLYLYVYVYIYIYILKLFSAPWCLYFNIIHRSAALRSVLLITGC